MCTASFSLRTLCPGSAFTCTYPDIPFSLYLGSLLVHSREKGSLPSLARFLHTIKACKSYYNSLGPLELHLARFEDMSFFFFLDNLIVTRALTLHIYWRTSRMTVRNQSNSGAAEGACGCHSIKRLVFVASFAVFVNRGSSVGHVTLLTV